MRERRFLFLTLVMVILVGGPTVHSVIREPASRPQAELKAKGDRQPARAGRNSIKAKSVTMEMVCKGESQFQETEGTLLRVKSDCWKKSVQKISVINKTNGFTAAVMETRSKGFTTDFIDLKEGDNNLEISGTDEQGQSVVRAMLVKRR